MANKAFITKRNAERSNETESLENNITKKYGFQIEKNFSSGTLISGDNLENFLKLRAEGYRVKNLS